MLKNNLLKIKNKIAEAAKTAGRKPEEIKLIAVSKTMGLEKVKEAIAASQFVFGENYLQEAKAKILQLREENIDQEIEFHFIGHLQRNKAKDAVGLFSMIQTVDTTELALEINKQAQKKGLIQKVLMQINISGEESKSGLLPEQAEELAQKILGLENLSWQGLMSIGHFYQEDLAEEQRRQEFKAMRELRDSLEKKLSRPLPELSMGMSHDFDLAIAEGSTMIRVGTAIFGERK